MIQCDWERSSCMFTHNALYCCVINGECSAFCTIYQHRYKTSDRAKTRTCDSDRSSTGACSVLKKYIFLRSNGLILCLSYCILCICTSVLLQRTVKYVELNEQYAETQEQTGDKLKGEKWWFPYGVCEQVLSPRVLFGLVYT